MDHSCLLGSKEGIVVKWFVVHELVECWRNSPWWECKVDLVVVGCKGSLDKYLRVPYGVSVVSITSPLVGIVE